MEVKDLNNNVMSIQSMFVKAVADVASGQALGGGFAELLGGAGDKVSAMIVKDGSQASDKASVKVANESDLNEKPVEAKPSESKVVETEEKEAVKKDNKEKSVVKNEENKVKTPVKRKQNISDEDCSDVNISVAQNTDAVASAELGDGDMVIESADCVEIVTEPLVRQDVDLISEMVSSDAVEALDNGVEAVLTTDGKLIVPVKTDLSKIAEMPVVQVFDDAINETIEMTGAEFVANLQEVASEGNLLMVNNQSQVGVTELVPVELKEVNDREFGFVKIDNSAVSDNEQVQIDPIIAEQAKVIDAKLGDDKKIKINVNVNEENFSYTEDVNLLLDKVALDDIVKSALKEKNIENNGSNTVVQNGIQQNFLAINNQGNGIAMPIATMSVGNVVQSGADSVQSLAVDGVSSVSNTSTGVLSNVGMVNAEHKAEGSVKTFDNATKDIYKGMSKEVVEQVKVNITKSAVKGVDKIDVQLKPQDLGNIEIKLQITKDGKLQAHIIASKAETMDMLQREVQDLEHAFNEAGFDTDSSSFSFSFKGDESGNEQRRNAELRSFIGNVLEQDSDEILGGNDNLQNWNPTQGLNIRV
ncbi:MAG: hypothetical protein E7012_05990 [Alphaproteobacteria bacterium]|nr:hypothetical protein [Alphaproteobacteria bacterium]